MTSRHMYEKSNKHAEFLAHGTHNVTNTEAE